MSHSRVPNNADLFLKLCGEMQGLGITENECGVSALGGEGAE